MKKLRLQETRIAGYPNSEGQLVFADEQLIAILVHLSEEYEEEAGQWYIEGAFGPDLDAPLKPTFINLDAAVNWLCEKVRSA